MSSAGAGRRDALRRVAAWGIAAAAAAPGVPAASARDELFKPNPLTNPVLEKIRILEQDYADNVQYGGELAPGSPQGRDQYAQLLVPILKMQRDLDDVYGLVREEDGAGLERADQLLRQKVFEKKEFKKTFNAFADNIYSSDPDRANAYLGGGRRAQERAVDRVPRAERRPDQFGKPAGRGDVPAEGETHGGSAGNGRPVLVLHIGEGGDGEVFGAGAAGRAAARKRVPGGERQRLAPSLATTSQCRRGGRSNDQRKGGRRAREPESEQG